MKKRIPLIIILLVLVGIATWSYLHPHAGNKTTQTLYGNVDIREVSLGFRVPGKLAELVFEEGDKVKAGQVMAKLDDEPYRNQLASAQAQVDSLRARLKLRETGNRPEEIAQAHSLVREREANANNAERLFKRAKELLTDKGISLQEHDNAEANHKEAQARLKSARDNLALLEAGFRSEDITQAKADLAQTLAALATASLLLKDTTLTAPSEGVILTRAQEVGAILQAGTPVYTLSLVNPVLIRAYIHEPDLGRIHPGMKVEIRTDFLEGKSYRGQIGHISPRAEFTPKTVETAELRTSLVYRLRIVVENPDDALRQGMPVTIILGESTLNTAGPS